MLLSGYPQIGFATLYGHLLEKSLLVEGQFVRQGEVIGHSGDADGVCTSRPHLHFELRSLDFQTTYNPVNYMDAPWQTLSTIGQLTVPQFQRDLDNPELWLSIDDQPSVNFGGSFLNAYAGTHPYPFDVQPPMTAPLASSVPPPSDNWTLSQITDNGCCAYTWWHPVDSTHFYSFGNPGIIEWSLDGALTPVSSTHPDLLSPDGTHRIVQSNGITVEDMVNKNQWEVDTDGQIPAISPDDSHLLWQVPEFLLIPGENYPNVQTFVSDIDGSNRRLIWEQLGGQVMWLDASRVLIVTPALDHTDTTLTVVDIGTGSSFQLGRWDWLRGLSISPGGKRLLFYLIWQSNPANNGVYTIETQAGAIAQRLPWFGGWHWRDSDSVFYIPFTVSWFNQDRQVLAYYDIPTGSGRYLTNINTLPLTIANGDWSVSPDGQKIVFRSATDNNLWLLSPR